ncbi:hypothetical protein [Microseira sp. BLCC-F43]|jgi:hypothetical protein|uniref:hypothetical protein n=1 Tax=Microseira sp. BLCC-F43 TaxID=3153602 RepID=UPI0035BAEA2E
MAGITEKYSHQQLASLRLAIEQPTIVITSNLRYLSVYRRHSSIFENQQIILNFYTSQAQLSAFTHFLR